MKKRAKGMRLDKMLERAAELLRKNGKFLLCYDVVGSRAWCDGGRSRARKLHAHLARFRRHANRRFAQALATGPMGQFQLHQLTWLLGDSGAAYYRSIKAVDGIVTLAKRMLPFKLRWAIAEDDFDERCKRILC